MASGHSINSTTLEDTRQGLGKAAPRLQDSFDFVRFYASRWQSLQSSQTGIGLNIRLGSMLTEVPIAFGGEKNCVRHRRRPYRFSQSPFLSCCARFPLPQLSEEMVLQSFIIFGFFGISTEAICGFPFST